LSKDSLSTDSLWLIHRAGDDFLSSMYEEIAHIPPKANVRQVMDRRPRIYTMLLNDRVSFFGDIMAKAGPLITKALEEMSPLIGRKAKLPKGWPFDVPGVGLWQVIYEDDAKEATELQYIDGLRVGHLLQLVSVAGRAHRPRRYEQQTPTGSVGKVGDPRRGLPSRSQEGVQDWVHFRHQR